MNARTRYARRAIACLIAATFAVGQPAVADERESLEMMRETTLNLIDGLVEQGVFTREQADKMVQAAQAKAAKTAAKEKEKTKNAPVRVQYVPETVKNEIRDQLRQEVLAQAKAERWAEPNAVPAWLDRIKWEGDVRVRYQSEAFANNNASAQDYSEEALVGWGSATRAAGFVSQDDYGVTGNSSEDRNRYRVRARLGMLARISDDWSGGIRLATGSETDRVSTNQTMGNNFNKYTLSLDRAYINYTPTEWMTLVGGRMPNPWYSTDLMWDEDLNFDGFAATFKPAVGNGSFRPFVTVGAFPLLEDAPPKQDSRWIFGVQGGGKWEFAQNTQLTFGAAIYDFSNLEGQLQADEAYYDLSSSAGSPAYRMYEYGSSLRQKGNTLFRTNPVADTTYASIWGLASKFRPLNLTASLDLAHFDPVHVVLTADYIKNTAFDRSEIQRRTDVDLSDGKDYGYLAKVLVGMPKLEKRHDWQATFAYRYLGSDATLDAFTDSDFGLGGTNLKGYQLGFSYGLDPNAWLTVRYMSAESIDSFSLNSDHRYSVDLLQADVNVRF